tara:strand:+ start:21838 stop:22197 length:360 start_codon:yes stop_codon:yes gene_type:complete
MKSILFSIFFIVVGFSSFSQEAFVENKQIFERSIADGVISMILPANITKEDVAKYAKYYTPYFTTSFDESSHKVTFTMVNNDVKSRRVIMRFLGASKIQTIKVEDQSYLVHELYETFLN